MKHAMNYRFITAVLGLMLTVNSIQAAEKHMIVMDRSHVVGDTYRAQMTFSSTEASRQSLDGQKIGSETKSMAAKLTAVIEVLELHEDESVKRVALKVESFEGEFNGKPIEIDTSKRLIVTGDEESNSYAYENGGTITDTKAIELFDLFGDIIVDNENSDADRDEDVSEQKIYNLQEPRAVGASWKCNERLMARDMAEEGLVIDPKEITSQIKFIDIQEHLGVRCAKLDIAVEMNKLALPELADQGFALDNSALNITVNGLLPLDPEINGGTFNLSMDMVFSASADIPQGKIQIDVDAENSLQIVHLPMK